MVIDHSCSWLWGTFNIGRMHISFVSLFTYFYRDGGGGGGASVHPTSAVPEIVVP